MLDNQFYREALGKQYIVNAVREAKRIKAQVGNKPVILFTWHRYFDFGGGPRPYGLMEVQDLKNNYETAYKEGADGVFMWGYVDTNGLANIEGSFLRDIVGPTIRDLIARACV